MKNIGVEASKPKGECKDGKCPFHSSLKVRGRTFSGTVVSGKMQKTAIVEWEWKHFLKKYERLEKRRNKAKAHNPGCVNAKEGDVVKIMECRPLSKSKNFVIIKILGKEKGFTQRMELEEESKIKKEKPKEELTESGKNESD